MPSSSPVKDNESKATFVKNKWKINDSDDSEDDHRKPLLPEALKEPLTYDSPEKRKEVFRSLDLGLDSEIVSKAQELVEQDRGKFEPLTMDAEDDDDDFLLSMTQQSRCPMCGAHVSPGVIRENSKSGHMNVRTQERFCRAHRVKSAEEDWESNEYPTIDWEKLDSRISKHHAFIKKLINGQESHYRDRLNKKVDAGKDRNLRKMTSNLTPGYYGARGLRLISENIFHKFTPLLKKRMVQDPLMSARGYTAYVQTVLVPEATVLLIQEDMKVDAEEARKILSESVEVGELLNEEIEDVVRKKVPDDTGSEDPEV